MRKLQAFVALFETDLDIVDYRGAVCNQEEVFRKVHLIKGGLHATTKDLNLELRKI